MPDGCCRVGPGCGVSGGLVIVGGTGTQLIGARRLPPIAAISRGSPAESLGSGPSSRRIARSMTLPSKACSTSPEMSWRSMIIAGWFLFTFSDVFAQCRALRRLPSRKASIALLL